jgi:hypothetical protein
MKCEQCGTKNDPQSKFCKECGVDLQSPAEQQTVTTISELYGKEVEVLFFIENFTGKISGIVNPSEDQIGRYREGIIQKVTIEAPGGNATEEGVGAILTFIRQSKEYLGEEYNEGNYRTFSPADLKKEYLRLFERILKVKAQRGEMKPASSAKTEKK